MGSPLTAVLACLYPKFLESGPFKYIIPSSTSYIFSNLPTTF